ncbi:hypothetical protein BYT27DRAFT_7191087 [Phlegmacium glaucopus]|nr:hypothetical protein BYT27DRAFT_7191087 [Phlegmacium glaucopus]
MSNEDAFPTSYKYSWPDNSGALQDFLTKFKPSMVQNDGTKPWIWVRGSGPLKEDSGTGEALAREEAAKLLKEVTDEALAREEAAKLLKEVTEKVENIKNDDSIPLRSNKKTGAKSKKEVREQVQTEATEKLKEIAIRHGYVGGKWLLFSPPDKVDMIWSSIASSLVSGPLCSTSAYLAKVSTSPAQETANVQHLICVYLPDVYDKASVTEVMRVLLRNHGLNLSGVKSDLYTVIGIDSKHPSGIPSTVWKNAAILPEKEAKELKDAFYAELGQNKLVTIENPAESSSTVPKAATTSTKGKSKPKLKKVADDPFASDNDDDDKEDGSIQKDVKAEKEKAKSSKTSKAKTKRSDDDEEEARPKKKRVT